MLKEKTMKRITLSFFLLVSFLSKLSLAQLLSPESHLGFPVGADRKLADWKEIMSYFAVLDKASDRLQVVELGKSTEGRPLVLAVMTSPQNFARLNDILNIQRRLADPRQMPPDSLASCLRRG